MVDSIVGAGLRGMQQGMQDAARDAQRVTKAFSPENPEESTSAVEPIVDLQMDEKQVSASSKVIETGKRMIQSVLDLLA